MTAPHRFEISSNELDFGLCVTSGQVFRWEPTPRGWAGVDGDRWADVEIEGRSLLFSSSHSLESWRSFWDGQPQQTPPTLATNPFFGEYLAAVKGLRLLQPSCPVETLFSFLCTANNHLKRIGAMVRSLASFGEPMSDSRFTKFPSLERLASMRESELRSLGFGYRSATIPRVAQMILERGGTDWLQDLKRANLTHVRSELTSIPSIGPKLADCIALYALHHPRAVPVDTHLWSAATEHLFPEWRGLALTHKRVEAIQEFFSREFGDAAGWVQLVMYFGHLRLARGTLPE